jgi:hypothetical protein
MKIQSTSYIPSVSIENVAHQFQIWHKSKVNKFAPIPSDLRGLIKQLFHNYSIKEIINHLAISKPTLLIIKKEYDDNPLHTLKIQHNSNSNNNLEINQTIDFVPLDSLKQNSAGDTPSNSINILDSYSSCQIIKPSGTKLIIQTSDPKVIIQAFLCCN